MIVKTLEDVKARGHYAEKTGVWTSTRHLLKEDGVGFTLTQTTFAAGQSLTMQYKNHLEANMIVSGTAILTDESSGEVYTLEPGSTYTLDKHDRHTLEAKTDLTIICVFTPALTGKETHDADGSYPLL